MRSIPIIILSLFLAPGFLFGQTAAVRNIDFRVSLNTQDWKMDSKLVATISVQNNTPRSINLQLAPRYYLVKKGIDVSEDTLVASNTYYTGAMARRKISKTTSVLTEADKALYFPEMILEPGARQSLVMDLGRLGWACSNCSYAPEGPWYDVVPKGNYELYFDLTGEEESGKYPEYTYTRVVYPASNHIDVKLFDGVKGR